METASKVLFLVMDGLGDRPVAGLGGRTPLEAAHKPKFNHFAFHGATGLVDPVTRGICPGSDTSHLALFGYDPFQFYTGRGPLEAVGCGFDAKPTDVCLRVNLGTVENGVVTDRRAGRIEDIRPLLEGLNGTKVQGITFFLRPGIGYRGALVMRGGEAAISDGDPHSTGLPPLAVKSLVPKAKKTAVALNSFLEKAHRHLDNHPLNKERAKLGLPKANYLLVRGAGVLPSIPSFHRRWNLRASAIAAGGLYRGIARLLGMHIIDVAGATGTPTTDVRAKFAAAGEALRTFDFVFLHIKGTDVLGHDGKANEKKQFIERIDRELSVPAGTLFVATADHSTPCSLKAHSADPVPLLIHGPSVRSDAVREFSERAAAHGGLGRLRGIELLPEILGLLGRTPKYGE